jgi:hypothetical protein
MDQRNHGGQSVVFYVYLFHQIIDGHKKIQHSMNEGFPVHMLIFHQFYSRYR